MTDKKVRRIYKEIIADLTSHIVGGFTGTDGHGNYFAIVGMDAMVMENKKIVGVCSACSGNIVNEECWDLRPRLNFMNVPIGPASEDCYVKSGEIYCDDCGIQYRHLPKKKNNIATSKDGL